MHESENKVTALFGAMDRVRRAWHSVTPCDNLSKSQFATLIAIGKQSKQESQNPNKSPSVTLSALADYMHQSRPALSQRVQALEKQGYVQRVPNHLDRRVSGVRLTNEGKIVLQQAHQRFRDIMAQVTNQLGEEVSSQLIDLLTDLAQALEITVARQNLKEPPQKREGESKE